MRGFLVIIFLVCASNSFAQRVATDYGDIYFEFFQFKEAIKYYDEALLTSTKPKQVQYLNEQLSQCYKYLFQYQKAETYFVNVMTSGEEIKPEFYIDYGNILKLNGKYGQAKEQFKKYQEVTGTDLAEPFIRSVSWAIRNSDTIKDYDVFPTDLDLSGQALGYCFYDDGLLYSHARNKPKLGKSQTPLFDLDYSRKVSNVDFEPDLKLMELIQFDLNEGSPSVTTDGLVLYFSANATSLNQGRKKTVGTIQVSDEGVSNFKIYAANSEGGMFQNPVPLPFNDEEYSCIHPCISYDGNVLFFSSNMPGGFGGFDLYKSVKQPDGVWSEPINMGKVVNTEENELFPWVSDDLIYFSSKGFNNYGGYDIFVAKLNKLGLPNNLKNIGQPINSYRDDVAFITKDAGRTGYFSSNRDNEEGNDFLYYVNESKPRAREEMATISSDSLSARKIGGIMATNTDKINSRIATGTAPTEMGVVATGAQPSTTKPLAVAGTAAVVAGATSAKPTTPSPTKPAAIVAGSNAKPSATKPTTGVTSSDVKTASSSKPEKVVAGSKPKPQSNTNIEAGNTDEVLNRTFTPVQFKFNDAGINESQMQAADSVIALLNANQKLKVFVAAHADSRGAFEYNLKLTDRRSASVKRYLISRGIPSSRIICRGFGESQLLNNCADGVSCTEDEHAVNRRVEMKLVK